MLMDLALLYQLYSFLKGEGKLINNKKRANKQLVSPCRAYESMLVHTEGARPDTVGSDHHRLVGTARLLVWELQYLSEVQCL